MARSVQLCELSMARWFRGTAMRKGSDRRARRAAYARAVVESLEARVLLTSMVQTGTTITLHLDSANEQVQVASLGSGIYSLTTTGTFSNGGLAPSAFTGFGGTAGTLTVASATQVVIDDNGGAVSGARVTFNDSGTNAYAESIHVSLTGTASGLIDFNGISTFNAGLTAATAGNLTLNADSILSLNGSPSVLQSGTNSSVTLGGSLVATSTTLAVNSGRSVTQAAGTTISTSAVTATTLTVTGGPGDILLGNSNNDLAGSVTIVQSGSGAVRDVNLRNEDPAAQVPMATGLSIRNYTLQFDNTSIALPGGLSVSGNLAISAGSGITETGAVSASGAGTFTVLSNGSIVLNSTAGNSIAGAVALNDSTGDNTTVVAYTGSGAVGLAASSVGLGTLAVTALNGNITQTGALTQKRGAGAATFTLAGAGNTITLANGSNELEGPVTFAGTAGTASLSNTSTLAAVPALAPSVQNLTLTFANAPAVLPNLNLSVLTVNAQGIYQTVGSATVVSGNADLQANANPLVLANTSNDFTNVRLRTAGPNPVAIADANSINFAVGNSSIGSGSFTVNAGGAITQSANTITQALNAGLATFTAGIGFAITLGQNNTFRGPVLFNTSGASGNVTLNDSAVVTLGTSVIGGNLSVGSGASQDPGATLTIAGTTTVGTGGAVTTLDNPGNTFTGSVGVTGSSVTIRDGGTLDFAASNVTTSLTVHADGAITQSGAITGGATTTFDAGGAAITLTNAANALGTFSANSTGSAAITVTNSGTLALGQLNLGSGALTVTCTNLSQAASAGGITQTAAIPLTFNVSGSLLLQSTNNDFLGAISLPTGAATATLVTQGDLSFSGTPSLSGTINFTSGGVLTLPNAALNVTRFTASAANTVVSQNITTTGGGTAVQFTGAVTLASGVTLDASASAAAQVVFNGNVMPAGPLTITLGSTGQLNLLGGTWTQGTSTLTINGASIFNIGNGTTPAVFAMTSGTINMPNAGNVVVGAEGRFKVGGTSGVDVVTVHNGAGNIVFQNGSTLSVGLGATNDELAKQAGDTGNIVINTGARLTSYAGVTGAVASPVLDAASGIIDTSGGFFNMTVDSSNAAHVFLMGTDIVQPTYGSGRLTIGSAGTVSSGTATGFEPDSDMFTLKATVAGASNPQLVYAQNVLGQLDVVVRNAVGATTLAITTTRSFGDGFTAIGGIAIDGPGAATINAPTSNVNNDILVAGPLTALTIRDFNGNADGSNVIRAGGSASQATNITGRAFTNVSIDLPTVLNALTVNELSDIASNNNFVSADRFGIIKATPLPTANLAGDFLVAHVINLNAANSALPAVGTVSVAGKLGGATTSAWDINGSVTSITAALASGLSLGLAGGANVKNGNKLFNVGTFAPGVAASTSIMATGKVAAITATSWSGGTLVAAAFGAIKTTGSSTLGNFGNFDNVNLVATGSSSSFASLSVAGNSTGATILLDNGNAPSISVARQATNMSITAVNTPLGGTIAALTAGAFSNLTLDAKSAGTIAAIGNAAANLFGDISGSTIKLHGTPGVAGVTLGTLKASHNLQGGSTITVENGAITTIAVGRSINNANIIANSTNGVISTLTAVEWTSGGGTNNLVAASIGKLATTGTPLTLTNSSFLPGDFTQVNVLTFGAAGTTPDIGTFSVAGNYNFANNGFLRANNGITSLTVGRQVLGSGSSLVSVQNALPTSDVPGRIAALTAGAWNTVDIAARTLGTVKVIGYTTPENPTPALTPGNVIGSRIGLFGVTASSHVSFDSLTANSLTGDRLVAPFGINTLMAAANISTTTITTDNPDNSSSGHLTTLQAASFTSDSIRAVSITALKGVANVPLGLTGDFTGSDLTVTGFAGTPLAPVAVGTMSFAGSVNQSTFNIPFSVTTLSATQGIGDGGGVQLAAGFGANAGIATLAAANVVQASITTRRIGTFSLAGNADLSLPGDLLNSVVTLTGNLAGVALGTFGATGRVSDSIIDVTGGNVTSFVTGAFLSSRLLVGFEMPGAGSIATAPSAGNWLAGNFTLGTFKTTGIFSAGNIPFTASFRDSFVVAQKLGAVTIAGLDSSIPASSTTTSFGVAFRTSAGAGPKILVNGSTHSSSFVVGGFNYLGLQG